MVQATTVWKATFWTVAASLLLRGNADINFTRFVKDTQGAKQYLRLLGAVQVDYFSTEFNELCPEVGAAAIADPQGLQERFQYPQRRVVDPNEASLPTFNYLVDNQLDDPYSGRVVNRAYTEASPSKEFVADGDLLPTPHSRTQLCHYAIRLTPTRGSMNAAVWYRFKQTMAYGFDAEFDFRILHPTISCVVAGQPSEWCDRNGGDGFAFVIQNDARDAIGTEVAGLGYAIRKSLAIEFDTVRDTEMADPSAHHISIKAPPQPDMTNSGRHQEYEVAHALDIPNLYEGTHHVRISYDVKHLGFDQVAGHITDDLHADYLRKDAYARPGILSVTIDGKTVISIQIDLVRIVQPDPTATAKVNPPIPPDPAAFDDLGAMPGRAWVGFTGSTNFNAWQCVDILSWTFKEHVNCPDAAAATPQFPPPQNSSEIRCRIDNGTAGRYAARNAIGNRSELGSLFLQNAARTPIMFTAKYIYDRESYSTTCENGYLEWDHLHPYFLGCSRTLRFQFDMTELWITSTDNSRTSVLDKKDEVTSSILMNNPNITKRNSVIRYCVTEHKSDMKRLQVAECNCEYCVRMLDISASYAMFYQHVCKARFSMLCPCFEVSEMSNDASKWMYNDPMTYMRLHVCRGCSYSSQCNFMLRVGECEIPYQTYTIGNPLAPTIYQNGFQNNSRDGGRVLDGTIRGDACNCEPKLRPYRGPGGGKGECPSTVKIESLTGLAVSLCALRCQASVACQFFTTWPDGGCITYMRCDPWLPCTTDRCFAGTVWQFAALGDYTDVMNVRQNWKIFRLRGLQATRDECFSCLSDYEDTYCKSQCGAAVNVTYLHWPGGPKCSTCMYAGNRMFELTPSSTQKVKDCVSQALRDANDPWVVCDAIVQRYGRMSALDLFNGVVSHFLSECPARKFEDGGAVCVPNLLATNYLPAQVLARLFAINNTVWGKGLDCLDGMCRLVERSKCYKRVVMLQFIQNLDDFYQNVKGISFNNPTLLLGGLQLVKSLKQYLITTPIPVPLINYTLEGWVEVGAIETVTNVAINVSASGNSFWSDDYEAWKVTDGDFNTFWSSQLGMIGDMKLKATLLFSLNASVYVESGAIYWKAPAADFEVLASDDQVTWRSLLAKTQNVDMTTSFELFFRASWVRIDMTRASTVRSEGIGYLQPLYQMFEFTLTIDTELSRLKPTNSTNYFVRPAADAHDGDFTTWWGSMPGETSAMFWLDLGVYHERISSIKIFWRYKPQSVSVYSGVGACTGDMPENLMGSYENVFVPKVLSLRQLWNGRCIGLAMDTLAMYYGRTLVALDEIQVFKEDYNAALNRSGSAVSDFSPVVAASNILNAFDGVLSTSWNVQITTSSKAYVVFDLRSGLNVISIVIQWGTTGGIDFKASAYTLKAGPSLTTMTTYYDVQDSAAKEVRVLILENIRFVRFDILRPFASNPNGFVALADLLVWASSDNLAQSPEAAANASNSWANCSTCTVVDMGGTYPHDADKANDGDQSTWFGLPFGSSNSFAVSLDILLEIATTVDVYVISWIYPAVEVTLTCSARAGATTRMTFVAAATGINTYRTVLMPAVQQNCLLVRLNIGAPSQQFAKAWLTGIREVEIYTFGVNRALNRPVIASDRSDASKLVDASLVTAWVSSSADPVNFTVDLGQLVNFWGIRIIFATGLQAGEITALAGNSTGGPFTRLDYLLGNSNLNVFMMQRCSAQVVVIKLDAASVTGLFGIRSLFVYDSRNLAIARPVTATNFWKHGSFETVDGDPASFWVSEPLAARATLSIDLTEKLYIAGGISIDWLDGYQAQDFDIFVGDTLSNMTLLESMRGNTNNFTYHDTYFRARYIEVSMYRATPTNGDGMVAIRSFRARFDSNMAHGKLITASQTRNASSFGAGYAIDNDMATVWLGQMGVDNQRIVILIGADQRMSGMDIWWGRPPAAYNVEAYHLGQWTLIHEVLPERAASVTLEYQFFSFGFDAEKIAIHVLKVADSLEGPMVTLKEVMFYRASLDVNYANIEYADSYSASDEEIVGNDAHYAVDGDWRFSYWQPGWGIRSAWYEVTLPLVGDDQHVLLIGRVIVYWRWAPDTYRVLLWDGQNSHDPVVMYEGFNETTNKKTDFSLMYPTRRVRVEIIETTTEIGIHMIGAYEVYKSPPVGVEDVTDPFSTAPEKAIDLSNVTYWMAPPFVRDIWVLVDLLEVYDVYEITIWYGFEPQNFFLFISTDNVTWRDLKMMKQDRGVYVLEVVADIFPVRWLKITIPVPFIDNELGLFGTSIRDIAVSRFANLARKSVAVADSTWEYLGKWATDDDPDSMWMSRFGDKFCNFDLDLGSVKNIAGMEIHFGYYPKQYKIWVKETNNSSVAWTLAVWVPNNGDQIVIYNAHQLQFRGRYIRFDLSLPANTLYDPDYYGIQANAGSVFSIYTIKAFEHTGGGGAFGIQNLDGTQWNTITYGLRNPGEWVLSSEKDFVTIDYGVPPYDEVGTPIALCLTFRIVGTVGDDYVTEIQAYRNGFTLGPAVVRRAPKSRLTFPNQTRVVIGVRSSAHTWPYSPPPRGQFDPTDQVLHGKTHSPFFEGKVFNVTIIQNALTGEEVRGLYEAKTMPGGKELACHCYDACPTGSNRFFPGIPVPCSGQGACIGSGVEWVGVCVCGPGFFGANCENHCSTYPDGGCCEVDDDCDSGKYCDASIKSCFRRRNSSSNGSNGSNRTTR